MNCENCKYSSGNICVIPLYVNGEKYCGRVFPSSGSCNLWEERDDALMTMEKEK